jgi:hypothetical protein
MAATDRTDRNAVDQLLFKMARDGDIRRVKRGVYALPQDVGKIDKKERNGIQPTDPQRESDNLTYLTDLTGGPDLTKGTRQDHTEQHRLEEAGQHRLEETEQHRLEEAGQHRLEEAGGTVVGGTGRRAGDSRVSSSSGWPMKPRPTTIPIGS